MKREGLEIGGLLAEADQRNLPEYLPSELYMDEKLEIDVKILGRKIPRKGSVTMA